MLWLFPLPTYWFSLNFSALRSGNRHVLCHGQYLKAHLLLGLDTSATAVAEVGSSGKETQLHEGSCSDPTSSMGTDRLAICLWHLQLGVDEVKFSAIWKTEVFKTNCVTHHQWDSLELCIWGVRLAWDQTCCHFLWAGFLPAPDTDEHDLFIPSNNPCCKRILLVFWAQ